MEVGRVEVGAYFADHGVKAGLSGMERDVNRSASSMGSGFKNMLAGDLANTFGPAAGYANVLTAALNPATLAVGGLAVGMGAATKMAMDYNTMMVGVGKTTNLVGQDLVSLGSDLQKLQMEMGLTAEATTGMAEQAGSMGVGLGGTTKQQREEIVGFSKAVTMAAGAFKMDAATTADSFGHMGSVVFESFNDQRRAQGQAVMGWEEYVMKTGSAINSLADGMPAKEYQIIAAMDKIGPTLKSITPTEEQYADWMALSGVIISTGQSGEHTGEMLKDAVRYAQLDNGGDVSKILGTDTANLNQMLDEDAAGTMLQLAEAIGELPLADQAQAYKEFGMSGMEAMKLLTKEQDKAREKIKQTRDEYAKGVNLPKSWEMVAADANKQLDRVIETAKVGLTKLGQIAVPGATTMLTGMADSMMELIEWSERAYTAIDTLWDKWSGSSAGSAVNQVLSDMGGAIWEGTVGNVTGWAGGILSGLEALAGTGPAAEVGEDIGTTVGTGIKTGVSNTADEALEPIEDAAGDSGAEAGKTWADNFAELVKAGVSKEIAGIMAAFNVSDMRALDIINAQTKSKNEYGGLWGRGSGTIVADEEGINYQISYSTDKFGTTSYLYIDGQLMGETRENSSKEAALQDLFSQPGAEDKLTKTLSLNLQGRGGEAALVVETVDVELGFDVNVATANANQSLKKFSESQNWGDYLFGDKENTVLGELEWASNIGDDVAKSAVDDIGTALQEVSLENYPKIVAGVEALNRELGDMWGGFGPRSDVYTKLQSQYADAILAGVIDAKDLLKAQSTETTNLLADSLADGYITGSEKGALEARKTLLGLLKERYPVEFEAAGLDELLSQIEDTLAGKKIEIEVQAKTIWEDWSSAAYREKFLADNPQLSALITPSQGDEWSDAIGQMAEDAENGDQVAKAALQDWQIAVQGFADGTISSMGYASEALYDLIMLYPQLGKSGSWLRSFMGDYQSKVMSGLSDTEKGTYFPYTYSIWNPESNKGSMWGTSPSEDITVDQIESLDQIESPITINEMGTMAGAVMGAKLATDTLSGKAVQMQPDLATTATESQNATAHLTGIESHTGSMVGLLSSIDGKIGALSLAGSGSGSQSITKFVSSSGGQNSSLGSVASKVGGSIKRLFSSANAAYQDGGVPAQSGMAWLDKGDVVIGPNSSIASKGNLPAAADTASASLNRLAGAADKSSAAYQTTWRWFEDYAYEITAPASYKWSKYPAEPDVNVKGNVPVAWLSEGQPTGMDYIDAELQEVIAKSVGNSLVKPWFARGYEAQPEWWTEAATSLSPKYADEWSAAKGGEVAKPPSGQTAIVETSARQQGLTIADVWNSIYGESFTEGCIAANAPDKNLIYTPSAGAIAEAGRTWGKEETEAWSHLYGEAFTEGCISTNPPDKLLNFTPSAKLLAETARAQGAWGRQLVGSVGDGSAASPDGLTQSTDDNTESLQAIFPVLRILNSNAAKGSSELAANTHAMKGLGQDSVLSQLGGAANAKTGGAMAWGEGTPNVSDALTTASIWSAIYDDSGTCIAYVKPDPSLNFTPGKEYQPGGKWYHGNETVGRTIGQSYGDQALQEMYSYSGGSDASDAIKESSAAASKNSAQTNNLLAGLNTRTDKSNTTAAKSDQTLVDIESNTAISAVAGMYSMSWGGSYGSRYGSSGGSSIIGLANRGGDAYWGGTSVSGGGGWVSASPGPASGSSTAAWMNAGARAVGGSNAVQWAEGGVVTSPTLGWVGEAGETEYIVPQHRLDEFIAAAGAGESHIQSLSQIGSGRLVSVADQTMVNGQVSQSSYQSGGTPGIASLPSIVGPILSHISRQENTIASVREAAAQAPLAMNINMPLGPINFTGDAGNRADQDALLRRIENLITRAKQEIASELNYTRKLGRY